MNFGYAVLLLLGVIAALVLICLAFICFEKKHPDRKFDERQQASRGRAYHFSWVLSWCYGVALMLLFILQRGQEPTVEPYLLVLLGIMFQVMAFDCYCLFTDSAVPPSQKPVSFIISGISIGVMDLANAVLLGDSWDLPLTGEKSIGWVWLMCAVAFLFRGITLLLRQRRQAGE